MANEDPMLTGWLSEINDAAINLEPRISEYQFKREVIGILTNIFHPDTLQRYSRYVGELTKPLNVISDEDGKTILFTVPPLVMPPRPTIAQSGGVTAENMFYHLSREKELGRHNTNERIASFLIEITGFGNFVTDVIQPIRVILQRYNVEMAPVPGVDFPIQQPGQQQEQPDAAAPMARQSSFSDEYED